jgi:hypothetical protein
MLHHVVGDTYYVILEMSFLSVKTPFLVSFVAIGEGKIADLYFFLSYYL